MYNVFDHEYPDDASFAHHIRPCAICRDAQLGRLLGFSREILRDARVGRLYGLNSFSQNFKRRPTRASLRWTRAGYGFVTLEIRIAEKFVLAPICRVLLNVRARVVQTLFVAKM